MKFFAIAALGLLINIARFWIDVKKQPQKVSSRVLHCSPNHLLAFFTLTTFHSFQLFVHFYMKHNKNS